MKQRKRRNADLAVIGGGPGGSAAALTAARLGLSVLLFEPQVSPIEKPCGEGILPPGVDVLHELDLGDWLQHSVAFHTLNFAVPGGASLSVELERDGRALPRPRLDAALAAALAAESGVAWIRRRVTVDPLPAGSGFALEAAGERWTARTLVVADGLGGGGAAWLRTPRSRRRRTRIGVRARMAGSLPHGGVEVHMTPDCEVYLTPLPGGVVNVALLIDDFLRLPHGSRSILRWALARTPRAAAHLGELITSPTSRRLDRPKPRTVAGGGAFLVGDAGGGVDPILGSGITVALKSGVAAAREAAAIVAGGAVRRAAQRYAGAYGREVEARRRLASVMRTLARHPGLLRATAGAARLVPGLPRRLARVVAGSATSIAS